MMYSVVRDRGYISEVLRTTVTADSDDEAREILEGIGWTVTKIAHNTITVK